MDTLRSTFTSSMSGTMVPKRRTDILRRQDCALGRQATALRAVLGGLQWPSTQTAPWLQVSVSMMAGSVTTATTQTLLEAANKILRYAKENAGGGKAGGFRGSRPAAFYKHFLEPGSESYFERRVKVGLAVVRDPFRASGSLNLAFARGLPSAWVLQFRMNLARRTRSCGTLGSSSKIHTSFWKKDSGSFCYASRKASRSEKDNVRSLT